MHIFYNKYLHLCECVNFLHACRPPGPLAVRSRFTVPGQGQRGTAPLNQLCRFCIYVLHMHMHIPYCNIIWNKHLGMCAFLFIHRTYFVLNSNLLGFKIRYRPMFLNCLSLKYRGALVKSTKPSTIPFRLKKNHMSLILS